jgi:serine/threonine-protein kinase
MQPVAEASPQGTTLGRYLMYGEIAVGGMATVHFGRLRGERGFARTVAIKRLHPQYAADPDFVSMIVDEASLAVRVKHPNVVAPFDVVAIDEKELLLVMEYVHGEPLSRLLGACQRAGERVPLPVAISVIAQTLYGLHAAHEAVSDRGQPLNIVHRDVSPPNILCGVDGVARVLDFGVAKATMRANSTRKGTTKGKLSYMAPEQLRHGKVDRRSDIFAAGVVLWETLTLRKLFQGDDVGQVTEQVLAGEIPAPSKLNMLVPPGVDAVVLRALERTPEARFATAKEFALSLERALSPAPLGQVSDWVAHTGGERLAKRAADLAAIEQASVESLPTPPITLHKKITSGSTPALTLSSHSASLTALPRQPWWKHGNGVVLGAAVLVVVAVFAAMSQQRKEAPLEPAPAVSTPRPAVAPLPRATIQPLPVPVVIPPLHIEARAPERVRAASERPAKVVRRRAPRARTRTAAQMGAGPVCDPPYTIDARGIRRIKPECLKSQ